MKTITDCSAETLFPEADQRLTWEPCGYVINHGGPSGFDTKHAIYSICNDPLENNSPKALLENWHERTVMVLVKWLDGSPQALRYRNRDVITLRWNEEMPPYILL